MMQRGDQNQNVLFGNRRDAMPRADVKHHDGAFLPFRSWGGTPYTRLRTAHPFIRLHSANAVRGTAQGSIPASVSAFGCQSRVGSPLARATAVMITSV
jgi:hypothetical protein